MDLPLRAVRAGDPLFKLMGRGFAAAIVAFAVLGLLYVPQLCTSLFGGTAPVVNQFFINVTGDKIFPVYYLMAACAIGAVALYFVPETRGCSIRGRGIPGVDTKPELVPA